MSAFTCSGASALQTVRGFFEVEIFFVIDTRICCWDYSYIKHCFYMSNDKKDISILYFIAIDLNFRDSMSNVIYFRACQNR